MERWAHMDVEMDGWLDGQMDVQIDWKAAILTTVPPYLFG